MLDLIWIQTIWHSDGIPEIIFAKKSADDKMACTIIFPVGEELNDFVPQHPGSRIMLRHGYTIVYKFPTPLW